MLDVEHADTDLERLETDFEFRAGFDIPVVKQFRVVMQIIRQVSGRNALYQFNSRRLKKLEGDRNHQHSMRLNKKWRLIVEFRSAKPNEKIVIVAIENHYDQ